MGIFDRSWNLAKLSFGVIWKDKEILAFPIVGGIVGLLLKIVEKSAEKAKGVGKVVVMLIRGILGMAWTVLTAFAVQGIMINSKGPFVGIIVLAIFYFFVLMLVFEIAEDVYMTALYIYATTGRIPEGFDEETIARA